MHGSEVSIPWFSTELQNRAIAGVTDYFRFGEGHSWDANQAFRIHHTIRFRPISKHPVDAVVQMRGWLDVWLEFYVLKGDEECVDRIKALQATFRSLTSARFRRSRRESAGVQSLVVQANEEELDENTDAEVASKHPSGDIATKTSQVHKENSHDIVNNTQNSAATHEIHRNELRENEDTDSTRISQRVSKMVAESQKPALPSRIQDSCQSARDSAETSRPALKATRRKASMLQAHKAEYQQIETPIPEIKRGKYETLFLGMRNGVVHNMEDEPGNNSVQDRQPNNSASANVNLGDFSTEVSIEVEQPVTSQFLGDSTPTIVQREGQILEATRNVTSRTQTAVNPSQQTVSEPRSYSKFFNLQDPFGKMHTIPLDQHWRIVSNLIRHPRALC